MRNGLAALCLALLSCCGGGADRGPGKNLVLIVLDTTRADHLGCYGAETGATPTLDALAARGTRFERAYAASTLTPVSAGTMLTGAWPFRHGVRGLLTIGPQGLRRDLPTLAEVLGERGFSTGAFVSAVPIGRRYGFDRGFGVFDDAIDRTGAGQHEFQRRGDVTTDRALAWLDAVGDERFFLLLHHFDVHDATLAPPAEFLRGRVSFPVPGDADVPGRMRGLGKPGKRELYDAELAFSDAQVGRVLERLRARGLEDDTLVCVVADHGEGLGDHGFWTHGLLWEEQLRTALLLAGPGAPNGAVVSELVSLVDLAPTLAELLDVPFDAPDGASFAPLLSGEPIEPREVYAEVHHAEDDGFGRERRLFALRRGDFKLVLHPETGAHELFDLAVDPGETANLYGALQRQAEALRAGIQALGALDAWEPDPGAIDPELLRAAEGLGYAGAAGPDDSADDEGGG